LDVLSNVSTIDAAAIVPEEEMSDVTSQPNEDDDGSQLVTLRNSVSRLNAKFQALGAPPHVEESLQVQETADPVTRTAAMKMHQLAALDPNKEPISGNPVEVVEDESESTIDPGVVVVETEEQAVAFTPHVYADALVVEEAARETSTSRDAFPGDNETDTSLPVYSETVPSNGHKRLSRRQRIGGVLASIILVVAVAVAVALGMTCGGSGCSRKEPQASGRSQTPSIDGTLAPTASPTTSMKTNAIAQYINNITLTGRTIEGPTSILPNGPPEDIALKWLIQGDQLNFTLDSPSHRFRLQQRYALATMWVENKEQINGESRVKLS
jgi:hypothetical protein